MSDVLIANRVVKFLRSLASQCLGLRVIAAPPPTEKNSENVQNAQLIMIANDEIRQGVQTKASVLMWRSARCKRDVNSTLAKETIAMSSALADAEWTQVMIQDVLKRAVTTRDITKTHISLSGGRSK